MEYWNIGILEYWDRGTEGPEYSISKFSVYYSSFDIRYSIRPCQYPRSGLIIVATVTPVDKVSTTTHSTPCGGE